MSLSQVFNTNISIIIGQYTAWKSFITSLKVNRNDKHFKIKNILPPINHSSFHFLFTQTKKSRFLHRTDKKHISPKCLLNEQLNQQNTCINAINFRWCENLKLSEYKNACIFTVSTKIGNPLMIYEIFIQTQMWI